MLTTNHYDEAVTWYDEAVTWPLTPSAKAVVDKGYSDERTHLQYIESTLEARTWEG